MAEGTVDLTKLEESFNKKLESKESLISDLRKELDSVNKRSAKAELDKKDIEILNLKASVEMAKKDVESAQSLTNERNTQIKSFEAKVIELNEQIKVKSTDLEKATKELTETKNKQVLANRINQYRAKSGDKETKDEVLVNKFDLNKVTDEAFATMLEFIKTPVEEKPEDKVEEAARLAKAAVEGKKTDDKIIAPTDTSKPEDTLRATAAKLVQETFAKTLGKTEKKE